MKVMEAITTAFIAAALVILPSGCAADSSENIDKANNSTAEQSERKTVQEYIDAVTVNDPIEEAMDLSIEMISALKESDAQECQVLYTKIIKCCDSVIYFGDVPSAATNVNDIRVEIAHLIQNSATEVFKASAFSSPQDKTECIKEANALMVDAQAQIEEYRTKLSDLKSDYVS